MASAAALPCKVQKLSSRVVVLAQEPSAFPGERALQQLLEARDASDRTLSSAPAEKIPKHLRLIGVKHLVDKGMSSELEAVVGVASDALEPDIHDAVQAFGRAVLDFSRRMTASTRRKISPSLRHQGIFSSTEEKDNLDSRHLKVICRVMVAAVRAKLVSECQTLAHVAEGLAACLIQRPPVPVIPPTLAQCPVLIAFLVGACFERSGGFKAASTFRGLL